ncbi:glycosyltransferase [Flavobacterium sp.]|uniref:glycosyltransferase n=1 Tax=Flavobacterium sp. TaxID=239 RepID=UPI002625D948|nr:glycosyltransferase [Flavobacterium sp.]
MKKRICFIVSSPLTAKAFLLKHFEVLSEEFDISLIANFENEDLSFFKNVPLVHVESIGIHRSINIIQDIKSLLNLRSYLKKMQFDAIHTVTPKAGLVGILAAKSAGIKNRIHIFTGQVWHTKTGLFKLILMTIDKIIVKNATAILVDGESQRQYLIENKIVNKNNAFVLGKGSISGVDLNRFVPNDEVRKQMRTQLNLSDNEVAFMFLGRFNIDKGLLDLAHAFQKIRIKNKKATLILVGFDEEHLESKIRAIINDDTAVIFTGSTPKPQDYLQAADVFCLPSYREGFGTSVIEASLMKLPIICSDTYGLMETIIENETGLRHKVGDVKGIEHQMNVLLNDENKRKTFGENGANYVKKYFSAATISNEWADFYTKLFEENKK